MFVDKSGERSGPCRIKIAVSSVAVPQRDSSRRRGFSLDTKLSNIPNRSHGSEPVKLNSSKRPACDPTRSLLLLDHVLKSERATLSGNDFDRSRHICVTISLSLCMVFQRRGYEVTASRQDLQTCDMDMRSRCRFECRGINSIAILVMTSAGAELAMFIEEHIVRTLYKSSERTFSCLYTFFPRLAPSAGW